MDTTAETAIRDTFRRFSEASDRMDTEAALAVFAVEGEVTLVGSESGEIARGREELRAFLDRVLAAAGGYSWEWENMIFDGTDSVAWVFAEGYAQAGAGPNAVRVPYRATVVLEQRAGQWKWRLFHGSEPVSTSER